MIDPLDLPIHGLAQAEKEAVLLAGLAELTAFHRAACPGYARILAALRTPADFAAIEDLPFLPVQRFGYRQLMYYVVVKSVVMAIRGGRVGWGKLERRGSALVGKGG